jgi:NADH:ubiquinone oxidoreductase subunit 2 (subunit N)
MLTILAVLLAVAAIAMTYSQAKSKEQKRQIVIALCGVAILVCANQLWTISVGWRLENVPFFSTVTERQAEASLRQAEAAGKAAAEATSRYLSENRDILAQGQK